MAEFKTESPFCSEATYCPMKLDMGKAPNRLAFLKENWGDLWNLDKINTLSIKDLKCSLCVINLVIDAIANDKIHCPRSEIIYLMNTQMYIQNAYNIYNLKEELDNELKDIPSNHSNQSS